MIKLIKSIIICLVIVLISCNKKEEVVKLQKKQNSSQEKKSVLDYHENYFKELRKKMDRIEISLFKINDSVREDTTKLIRKYEMGDKSKINEFDLLFKSTRNRGYCCCPNTHYKIDLYNQKSRLKRYNVDTSEVKGKVLIYDTGYQTSYLISKNDWNSFIEKK